MKKRNLGEQGQVIILLVAGIISLLGFTALAIDGARLFMEQRNAQGTADTAAFTAATYIGQYELDYVKSNWMSGDQVEPHAEQAALERIRSNGYTDAAYDPFGSNDRLEITIEPYPDAGDLAGTSEFIIKVFLISEIDPVFAQLLYDGDLLVNVEAHAIITPGVPTNLGYGNALYALDDHACKAIKLTGNADIDISGSGIYADSDCDPNAIDFGGNAGTDIEGTVTTPGGIYEHGSGTVTTGGEVEGAAPNEFPDVPVPDCSGQPAGSWAVDDSSTPTKVVIYPGVFNSQIQITNKKNEQIFLPGLYCLNAGMKITNGNITAHDVTFYAPDDDISINGGVLDLIAPRGGEADDGTNSWNGMLFYLGEGSLTINGNGGTYMEGTIYAPGTPDPTCKINGSSTTDTYNTQFICNTVTVNGGAGLNIVFDNTNAWEYDPPPIMDLIQ
jgi:hypothetical protein